MEDTAIIRAKNNNMILMLSRGNLTEESKEKGKQKDLINRNLTFLCLVQEVHVVSLECLD